MSKRVLITGIASFTGPYIAQELSSHGYQVFGLSQHPFDSECATALEGNLLDVSGLENIIETCKPDFVIHLAAITFVPHGDVAEMYMTNIVGTRNLLAALSRLSTVPERILLASSANVYGNTVEGALDESTPFSPANDYATSKVAMELMAKTWSEILPISITRPFNYTGVGQAEKFLIPKLVTHFQQNKPEIELGNIDVIRDFSDVRFVSAAYRQLIESAFPGEAYNICSGQGCTLESIIAELSDIAGYKIGVAVNPDFVRENEVKKLVGDTEKLLRLCPSLEVMPIQNTLRWMFEECRPL
ncbi:MAG: GDP-mannose 4,6-dehydratase [Halioglobus sp.]|nr:GDP-mannose 4,6-dehydratase [Halioglobus sp.]